MAKQKLTGLSASLLQPAAPPAEGLQPNTTPMETGKPVVQTVKVPPDIYIRLKTMGARERRSSQDIILTAVREYLTTRNY